MTSKFITELYVKQRDEEGLWVVTKPLSYKSAFLDSVITVPAGFVTDFASVPRVPVVYALFGDRAHRESVIHDYLYQTHNATKYQADRVFLEAMKSRGKRFRVRFLMYLGVVFGGRKSYKSGPNRYRVLNHD